MISEKVLLLWMRIGSRDLRNSGSFHKFYVCRKHDRRSSSRYFYDSRSFWRGGSRCYCFAFHKNKRNCKTYKCIQCCKDGHFTQIDVVGDVFQEDPCRIPHRCLPKKIKTNSLERFLYQKLQNIRSDPAYADTPVRRLWQDMLDVVPLMENLSMEEVEELMDEFHKGGYAARRRTIAKALQRHDMPRATLEDLPNDLKNLPDGSLFLQHSQPGLYMFYSRSTLEKAVNNGLIAIVADGIHNLPPCELGKDAQLYTVHGVCNAGVDVPLVHVLMRRKTQSFYEKVFGIVKEELQDLNVDLAHLRIIIDFERAALSAIRKQCPSSPIEGCAFHLAQSWNRKAQSLGLRSEMKQRRVSSWWMTIKELIFLPPQLHRKIPAFFAPSNIPNTHPAYIKCKNFLSYLHKNWYRGPFASIWNKWGKEEIRTSNIAESYHRVLRLLIRENQAPVRKTLLCLRGSNNRAMCTLRNLERGVVRRLRRKDQLRRDKINRLMREYREQLLAPCVSTRLLTHYCQKMARFVSDKVI